MATFNANVYTQPNLSQAEINGKAGAYIGGTTDSLYTSQGYLLSQSGAIIAGGGPTDITRPSISNITPAPGTPISATQVIQLDVTDNLGTFTRILLVAKFGTTQEVIHDGDAFAFIYQNASCTVVSITNGFRYTILRTGGWPSGPSFVAFAIDTSGNENL